MDHLRVFITSEDKRPLVEELLSLAKAQVPFSRLLREVRHAALFDYDWEYFYLISPGLSLSEMVNHFRLICLRRGVEAETMVEPKHLENFRARLEKQTGLPLTSSSDPCPCVASV